MSGPAVPVRLDVHARRAACPTCSAPVAWYQTNVQRRECFEGDAAVVPDFEPYLPLGSATEVRPEFGYILETHRHTCQVTPNVFRKV